MNPLHQRLSRRNLLKGGGALGLGTVLPTLLLSACAGDSDQPSPTDPKNDAREARTLQFDLSSGAIAKPRLSLLRSTHHDTPLVAHTSESRARHRASDPVLQAIPDANLTHYLEGVDLPAAALQIGSVWGEHPTSAAPMLALHFVHVPTSSLQALEQRRLARGQTGRAVSAKLGGYGVSQAALDAAPLTSQLGPTADAIDVVTTLVFQHPAIANLNADLGADILDRIANLPCADDDYSCNPYNMSVVQVVSDMIQSGGYVTTTSTQSWAVLTTIADPVTGDPAVDDDGNLLYANTMNPALEAPMTLLMQQILNDIGDDPLFMNTNWQDPAGSAAAVTATAAVKAKRAVRAKTKRTAVARAAATAVGASAFTVVSDVSFHSRRSGVRLLDIGADDDRNIVVTVFNEFLKTNSAFVQYYDLNGDSLKNENPTTYDDGDAYYLGTISPDNQVMGVPVQLGEGGMTTNIRFVMPEGANSARFTYGSLGIGGGDPFSKKALIGSLVTLLVNIALPTMCLAFGIAADQGLSKALQAAMEDKPTLQIVLSVAAAALASGSMSNGISSSISNLSWKPFIIGLGSTLLTTLLTLCPRFAALLAANIISATAKKAIPVIGTAFWALALISDVATLVETIVESMASPVMQEINLSLGMASSVVVSRDPNDFQFPATATRIEVTALITQTETTTAPKSPSTGHRHVMGIATLTPGQVDPVSVPLTTLDADGGVLNYVLSGGYVTAYVSLYSDTNCLVGTGMSQVLVNMPTTATVIPVTITELLVPLDANTRYEYQSTLAYAGGSHLWDTSVAPPSATDAQLCQGNDGAICALHGLTVNTATGMAGYSYFAGDQGVTFCGGSGASSVNMIQGVFLGDNPDSGLKLSSCGSPDPMPIVYAPTGDQAYFLQLGSDGVHHVRGIDLSAANFDMQQTSSWGRFMNPQDAMCMVGAGYLAGVNRTTHTIETLSLAPRALNDDSNTYSIAFSAQSAGPGKRIGLLDTPVAVASFNGLLYVLEQGNRRVQVFDIDGSVPKPGPFVTSLGLPTTVIDIGGDSVLLDIAIEGTGIVYVLSRDMNGTSAANYHLDIYRKDGSFLSRTSGVAAANIAVDLFRNLYTLNYATVTNGPRTEPSLSKWLPKSSTACGTAAANPTASSRQAKACVGHAIA